jgi:hypothetical protein
MFLWWAQRLVAIYGSRTNQPFPLPGEQTVTGGDVA